MDGPNEVLAKLRGNSKLRISEQVMNALASGSRASFIVQATSADALSQCLAGAKSFNEFPGNLPGSWRQLTRLDNPMFVGELTAPELSEIVSWDCVLKVEENSRVRALPK